MFGDLTKIMKMAAQMKARMPEVQEKLAKSEYTAAAGGGAVRATVNGRMMLTGLTFSPAVLSDESMDADLLADMVKAAVAAAQEKAAQAAAEAMKELTGGMEIPGMGGLMP